MRVSFLRFPCWVAATLLTSGISLAAQAQIPSAQVVPDDSLGLESSVVVPTTAAAVPDLNIEGGAARGSALFHSFSEFNIGTGQRVYFLPESGIENIFTRVTGDATSHIFGTLGVSKESSANLFLMNPNGLLFGPGAKLDIQGSFFATSADEVAFGDDFAFSARSPTAPPPSLLTVQPSALFFTQANPSSIVSEARLEVGLGESLQLIGGDIDLSRSQNHKKDLQRQAIYARQGSIELGGLSEPGQILLSAENRVLLPEGIARADIFFNNASIVINDGGNGVINIYARDVNLKDQSKIVSGSSGDIFVAATRDLSLAGASQILSRITSKHTETSGGHITVRIGRDATLKNNSSIVRSIEDTDPLLDRERRHVDIRVTDNLVLDNSDLLNIVAGRKKIGGNYVVHTGDAGELRIQAGLLQMRSCIDIPSCKGNGNDFQSLISVNNLGDGGAGIIEMIANELIMEGPDDSGASGITASAAQHMDRRGSAGSISVDIDGRIIMTKRSKIEAKMKGAAEGAGNILINADSLSMRDVSSIATNFRGSAEADTDRDIRIDVDNSLDRTYAAVCA